MTRPPPTVRTIAESLHKKAPVKKPLTEGLGVLFVDYRYFKNVPKITLDKDFITFNNQAFSINHKPNTFAIHKYTKINQQEYINYNSIAETIDISPVVGVRADDFCSKAFTT